MMVNPEATNRKRLPWDVIAGMRVQPDQSVPRGTVLVNPDDYRSWQAAAYEVDISPKRSRDAFFGVHRAG